VILGYLIFTVGIAFLGFGHLVIRERLELAAHIHQRQEYIDFIENTLGPDVWRSYPNAEFGLNQNVPGAASIRITGFKYEEQPNFDYELSNWREIVQNDSFIDFPMNIIVSYYFENTRSSFAIIRLNDFTFRFNSSGMSEEGFVIVEKALKEYLTNFHENFHISPRYHPELVVTIFGRLNAEDEAAEVEMWQGFLSLHNINTELVRIIARYKLTEDDYNIRVFNVHDKVHDEFRAIFEVNIKTCHCNC
jgi:hypothetical protein